MKSARTLSFYLLPVLAVVLFNSNAFAQSSADCLACHEDPELTMEKNGREISIFTRKSTLNASPHGSLNCVACHVGFDPEMFPHKENIRPVRCTTCHQDATRKHKFHAAMLKAEEEAGTLQSACKDCHGEHDVLALSNPKSKFHSDNLMQSCGDCHGDAVESYTASIHGKAMAEGVEGTPTCISCHSQAVTESSDLDPLALKVAQEEMCLSCHLDNEDVRSRMTTSTGFIEAYDKSVHGLSLHGGNPDAANCVDCHGAHEVAPGTWSSSLVNKLNIPHMCGECHDGIKEEFMESSHGLALARNSGDAPSCTDCHGEHTILSADNPLSPVAPLNVSGMVCTPCHSSVKMAEKYGIVGDPSKSYLDSYHGLAMQGGSKTAANCASCHGVHSIKSSSDPTSSIHESNLQETCGTCHPNATEAFSKGQIHVVSTEKESGLQYWVTTIYIILIIVTIGGMGVHNLLDFRRKALDKLIARRRGHTHEVPHNLYLRMTVSERIQHALLALSFIVLVFTGFGLTYPNSWWVELIREYGGEWAFQARGIVHRIAGAVMLAVSLYHIYYLAFTARGRQFLKDMLPRIQDIKDVFNAFKYYLGKGPRPLFDRFSYIEKAEYWALIWGTVVMGVTGIMLWFHEYFGSLTSKEFLDIMTIIHFYEAWLATLAIIVWHLYFVIFNPDVYPMNVAWYKGTLTEHEMAEEHPLELERLKKEAGSVQIDTTEIGSAQDTDRTEDAGSEGTKPRADE